MSPISFLAVFVALFASVWSGRPPVEQMTSSEGTTLGNATIATITNATLVEVNVTKTSVEQSVTVAGDLNVTDATDMNGSMNLTRQLITILSLHPLCVSKVDGLYPLPTNCSQYLLCVIGTGTVLNCPSKHVFDFARRQCLPIEFAIGPCGNATDVSNATCPTASTILSSTNNQSMATDLIADDVDCNIYHRCLPDGRNLTVACSFGMVFDNATSSCQSPSLVERCSPMADSYATTICASQPSNGLYSDPSSCSRAVVCLEGVAFLHECDSEDLPYFNATLLTCTKIPVELDDKSCLSEPRLPHQGHGWHGHRNRHRGHGGHHNGGGDDDNQHGKGGDEDGHGSKGGDEDGHGSKGRGQEGRNDDDSHGKGGRQCHHGRC
jgi:hypothetical protein